MSSEESTELGMSPTAAVDANAGEESKTRFELPSPDDAGALASAPADSSAAQQTNSFVGLLSLNSLALGAGAGQPNSPTAASPKMVPLRSISRKSRSLEVAENQAV